MIGRQHPWPSSPVCYEVSRGYVYGLLHRHGWRKLGPRPRPPQGQKQLKNNSPPS
jgi:hypothetical protein